MGKATDQTPPEVRRSQVISVEGSRANTRDDQVAIEEPLEIRILHQENGRLLRSSLAVTMRTPGNDFELAAGFLFTEGIVAERQAVGEIAYCAHVPESAAGNVVNVFLRPEYPFDAAKFTRNVYTTSSCGVCGKTSLEMVQAVCPTQPVGTFQLSRDYFLQLPGKLANRQAVFAATGGLHAAALFDEQGELLLLREDVGRHNAMDKVIGSLFRDDRVPAGNTVILVSGRASYELVQKALMGGIPILAAVGAPSSLAIDLARRFEMTLVGFLRDGRFNVYSGEERIHL